MIYTEIKSKCETQNRSFNTELNTIHDQIEFLINALPAEDSKSKEQEMRLTVKRLRSRQRELWGLIVQTEEECFKKALAEEYGVVGNPKFDKAYSVAYSLGHSSGFSEIEGYFSDIVELIK